MAGVKQPIRKFLAGTMVKGELTYSRSVMWGVRAALLGLGSLGCVLAFVKLGPTIEIATLPQESWTTPAQTEIESTYLLPKPVFGGVMVGALRNWRDVPTDGGTFSIRSRREDFDDAVAAFDIAQPADDRSVSLLEGMDQASDRNRTPVLYHLALMKLSRQDLGTTRDALEAALNLITEAKKQKGASLATVLRLAWGEISVQYAYGHALSRLAEIDERAGDSARGDAAKHFEAALDAALALAKPPFDVYRHARGPIFELRSNANSTTTKALSDLGTHALWADYIAAKLRAGQGGDAWRRVSDALKNNDTQVQPHPRLALNIAILATLHGERESDRDWAKRLLGHAQAGGLAGQDVDSALAVAALVGYEGIRSGGANTSDANLWRAIAQWRNLLRQGKIAEFTQKYGDFVRNDPVNADRAASWRSQVLTRVGQQLSDRVRALSREGQPRLAKATDYFLLTHHSAFPLSVWGTAALHLYWLPLLLSLIIFVAVTVLPIMAVSAISRLYRETFTGLHYRDRKKNSRLP